ncbi:MAG: type I-E CRISPR-associated protein Cse1/CasA, partial [Vicinamibacterales bacterium]
MTIFNLTREPWIPVEALDGRVFELSTHDALRRAHELRALADPSPLVVAALTRHLLAVLHRSYDGPRSMKEWVSIARSRRFDVTCVNDYLSRVEDRMDLFHPMRPFGQTRGLLEQFGDYVMPIDELEVFRSRGGTGRVLFRHAPDRQPRRSAAR